MRFNIIHFAKRALVDEGFTVRKTHLHEIYAATVGYSSRAALGVLVTQAFKEIENFIPDYKRAIDRTCKLLMCNQKQAEKVIDVLLEILTLEVISGECTCVIYKSVDDFITSKHDELASWLIDGDDLSGEIALTNACFDYADISASELEDGKNLCFVAYLKGTNDPDMTYCGSNITVEGEIEVGKYRNFSDDFSKIKLVITPEDRSGYDY